ncbi:hypothetical protein [Altererythrobacter sp. Z27]|uniref:hypothetical protein n=1 Tax=Altererythrobacter sp. Z27 TaxID=3461147 RepID=UPI0040445A7B
MAHSIEVEIERNYAVFLDLLRSLLPKEAGRYALLHDQKLIGVFDSPADAERKGFEKFGKSPYSIQQVDSEPVDLGFYSYAIPEGPGSSESH